MSIYNVVLSQKRSVNVCIVGKSTRQQQIDTLRQYVIDV